eukprot:7951639-Pyramimonas_sp.AAC.1
MGGFVASGRMWLVGAHALAPGTPGIPAEPAPTAGPPPGGASSSSGGVKSPRGGVNSSQGGVNWLEAWALERARALPWPATLTELTLDAARAHGEICHNAGEVRRLAAAEARAGT